MPQLPTSFTYGSKTYPFKQILGRGGSGSVGLYGSPPAGYLVLKMSYCGVAGGQALGQDEARVALQLSQDSTCATTTSQGPKSGAELLRPPLATAFRDGCSYAIYEYVPDNLSEWLRRKRRRRSEEVSSIFLQLLGIMLCLKSKGFYYNDVKPSNLLISDNAAGIRLEIGDLGGLDKVGSSHMTITKSRLPPSLVSSLGWDKADVLASLLLGELTLQLLLRAPLPGEAHPMDDFLACLQNQPLDGCTDVLCGKLRENLADGLSIEEETVRDLMATALILLGYKGMFVPIHLIPGLPSPLFASQPPRR